MIVPQKVWAALTSLVSRKKEGEVIFTVNVYPPEGITAADWSAAVGKQVARSVKRNSQ